MSPNQTCALGISSCKHRPTPYSWPPRTSKNTKLSLTPSFHSGTSRSISSTVSSNGESDRRTTPGFSRSRFTVFSLAFEMANSSVLAQTYSFLTNPHESPPDSDCRMTVRPESITRNTATSQNSSIRSNMSFGVESGLKKSTASRISSSVQSLQDE